MQGGDPLQRLQGPGGALFARSGRKTSLLLINSTFSHNTAGNMQARTNWSIVRGYPCCEDKNLLVQVWARQDFVSHGGAVNLLYGVATFLHCTFLSNQVVLGRQGLYTSDNHDVRSVCVF